jgi:hypothetical protein
MRSQHSRPADSSGLDGSRTEQPIHESPVEPISDATFTHLRRVFLILSNEQLQNVTAPIPFVDAFWLLSAQSALHSFQTLSGGPHKTLSAKVRQG